MFIFNECILLGFFQVTKRHIACWEICWNRSDDNATYLHAPLELDNSSSVHRALITRLCRQGYTLNEFQAFKHVESCDDLVGLAQLHREESSFYADQVYLVSVVIDGNGLVSSFAVMST
jgi:hypothetical protein